MMLTRTTAASVGITNRLDPVQSIHGGAKYLARLQKRIASDLPKPDKTLITLAAYNVGPGHLADAQHLASRLNKDPERWDELKQVLPLLAKKLVLQISSSRLCPRMGARSLCSTNPLLSIAFRNSRLINAHNPPICLNQIPLSHPKGCYREGTSSYQAKNRLPAASWIAITAG